MPWVVALHHGDVSDLIRSNYTSLYRLDSQIQIRLSDRLLRSCSSKHHCPFSLSDRTITNPHGGGGGGGGGGHVFFGTLVVAWSCAKIERCIFHYTLSSII